MSEEAPISQKPNPVHLMLGIIFGLIVIVLPRALGAKGDKWASAPALWPLKRGFQERNG